LPGGKANLPARGLPWPRVRVHNDIDGCPPETALEDQTAEAPASEEERGMGGILPLVDFTNSTN
jgi:hypothetical protein